jgi:hypothetical protein
MIINKHLIEPVCDRIFRSYFYAESINIIVKSTGLEIYVRAFPPYILKKGPCLPVGVGENIVGKEKGNHTDGRD